MAAALSRRSGREWNHGAGPGTQERRWLSACLIFFVIGVALAALILLAGAMAG